MEPPYYPPYDPYSFRPLMGRPGYPAPIPYNMPPGSGPYVPYALPGGAQPYHPMYPPMIRPYDSSVLYGQDMGRYVDPYHVQLQGGQAGHSAAEDDHLQVENVEDEPEG